MMDTVRATILANLSGIILYTILYKVWLENGVPGLVGWLAEKMTYPPGHRVVDAPNKQSR